MAGILDSINKGVTAITLKSGNMLEEQKLRTYITTLESEIKELKQQAGEIIFEKYKADNEVPADVEAQMKSISEKYEEIDIQKNKIKNLQEESQKILGSQNQAASIPEPQGETVFCAQCGSPNGSNYKFCVKCGSSLG